MDCGSIRGIADEVDCGISAFANLELTPIGGSLKSFPEDFVVEELPLEDGKVEGQVEGEERLAIEDDPKRLLEGQGESES